MMMFTDAGSDRTGTPIASAALADPLRLHFWIDDNYVGKNIPGD